MGCRQIPAQISAPSSVRGDSRRVKGGLARRETASTSGFPLVRPYTPPCYKRARTPASSPPRPAVHPLPLLQGNTRARRRPPRPAIHPPPRCRETCAPASDFAFPLNPCPIGRPPASTASALPAATVQTTVAPSRTGAKRGPLSAVTAPPAGNKTAPPPSPASPTGPGPQAGAHSL